GAALRGGPGEPPLEARSGTPSWCACTRPTAGGGGTADAGCGATPALAAAEVDAAMRHALDIVPGLGRSDELIDIYRTWRVARLVDLLRPDWGAVPEIRDRLRALTPALETIWPAASSR